MNTYTLRPHQSHAIELLRHSFRNGHRTPLLQASTGFGKTLVSVDIIKSALEKGKRVLFVVDRITLIDQTSEVFDSFGLDHGIIQGDHWRVNNHPLQLASAQSLGKRKYKPDADLIIVDEAHSTYSAMTKLITREWNALPFIGLSATPFTKGLGKIYDDLILVESTKSLIDKGYLCDFEAYGAPLDLKGVRTTAGDYNQKDLEKKVNRKQIVGDVVDTWFRLGDNRQTICFAVSVDHSRAIVDEFVANGVPAAHLDAHTPAEQRREIFDAHNAGDIKIISNVGITTKGFDSPNSSCLILARPTKSLMLYIQMVGRVLRVSDCGRNAIILDHGTNIERLGFPTDPLPEFLCNGDKESAERKKQEKKDREEKLPKPCEKCTHVSIEFACPQCGYTPRRAPKVETVSGMLKKMQQVPMEEKRKWYSMLLGYSRDKGFKDGWADHKYRERFGVWFRGKDGVRAAAPDKEVLNYIKYLQIRSAKA